MGYGYEARSARLTVGRSGRQFGVSVMLKRRTALPIDALMNTNFGKINTSAHDHVRNNLRLSTCICG